MTAIAGRARVDYRRYLKRWRLVARGRPDTHYRMRAGFEGIEEWRAENAALSRTAGALICRAFFARRRAIKTKPWRRNILHH